MRRNFLLSLMSVLALVGLSHLAGCGNTDDDASSSDRALALAACGLDDGTVDINADLRACDPQNTKKTTICHIPPGNPANAHTLCVGNSAVSAHLRNHGDHVGACVVEKPCPPPTTGSGGAPGATSSGGAPGATGSGGAPATDAGVVIVP